MRGQSLRARRESGEFLERRIRASLQRRTKRAESREARVTGGEEPECKQGSDLAGKTKFTRAGVNQRRIVV